MTHFKRGVVSAALAAVSLVAGGAWAQDSTPASRLPITPKQRSTADQVAQAGVPLSALAPNAPERYTVRTEPAAVAGEITYLGFGGKLIDQITTTAALDAVWSEARIEVPRLDYMITSYQAQVSDHLPAVLIVPRP